MALHFNATQIGEYMRDRIWTALNPAVADGGLGLQVCSWGDMEPFPADVNISSKLPAVYISPESLQNDFQTLNQRYSDYYTFRVLYLDVIPESVTSIHHRIRIERVADVIMGDLRLDNVAGLTLNNSQVVWSVVRGIEYRPPEDNLVNSVNANVYVAAVNWQVRLITWHPT
jgi:hypothetical protein